VLLRRAAYWKLTAMTFLSSLATEVGWTVCRMLRRRRWRGKVLGSFLQQQWYAAGGHGASERLWAQMKSSDTEEKKGCALTKGQRMMRRALWRNIRGLGGLRTQRFLAGVSPVDREIRSLITTSTWGKRGQTRVSGDAPCRGMTAGRRRGARGHRRQRNRQEEPADERRFGEQLEQPGGAIRRERRGGMEREMRVL
jgi:hypothetical protein